MRSEEANIQQRQTDTKRMIIIFLKIILKRVDNTKLMNDYNFSKRMIIIFVKKLLQTASVHMVTLSKATPHPNNLQNSTICSIFSTQTGAEWKNRLILTKNQKNIEKFA